MPASNASKGLPPPDHSSYFAGEVYPLQVLRPLHRLMARSLVFTGQAQKEIGEVFDLNQSTVSRILRSPLFQAEVARLEAGVEIQTQGLMADLLILAKTATEVLDRELQGNPSSLEARKHQTSVAFGVLDKVVKGGPSVHLHKHQHEEEAKDLSDEDLFREVIDLTEDVSKTWGE